MQGKEGTRKKDGCLYPVALLPQEASLQSQLALGERLGHEGVKGEERCGAGEGRRDQEGEAARLDQVHYSTGSLLS